MEQTLLEALGLTSYQARLLVVLCTAGDANSAELAEASGVPRTSIYAAMAGLAARGLVTVGQERWNVRWSAEWPQVLHGLAQMGQREAEARRGDLDRLTALVAP